ncbi:MAG: hypothetical protein WD969_14650 [Paracoccaceae bacterium]
MKLFFRIREAGAAVFRPDQDESRRRQDLAPLADISVLSGEVKLRGGVRRAELCAREAETPARAAEALNLAAQRISAREQAEARAETDAPLRAIHDHRSATVRLRGRGAGRE